MDINDALTAIESMLPRVKDGSLPASFVDYHFVDNKHRYVISTGEGMITYLNIQNEDGSVYSVFESFNTWDENLQEVRVGDQWSPLIELSGEQTLRFNAALADFLS